MILVTGGTGLVGSHLLYHLLAKGNDVRAIYRAKSKLDRVLHVFALYTDAPGDLMERIEWVEADINDVPLLEAAMEGIRFVYHCAAWISFDPGHFRKLKKINVEGTANLVNLALDKEIVKFCFVSSIAALGTEPAGKWIDEETHWDPEADNSVYAITKYAAEMEVWRGTQEGLDAVIVNPAVILGTGLRGSGSGSIIRMAAKGTKYYTPGGVAVVDVRDVVNAMILLMESSVRNKRFVLAAENLHNREFFESLAQAFGVQKPQRPLARWKLSALRLLDWLSNRLMGSRRRLFKATVNSLYTTNFYDGGLIENELPFAYTSFEDSVKWIKKHYRAGRH